MVREVTSSKTDIDSGHLTMRHTIQKEGEKKEYEAINVFI